MLGSKTKVKFEAFKKSSFKGLIGKWEGNFSPEEMSFGAKNTFNFNPEIGSNSGESIYEKSEAECFDISLEINDKADSSFKSQAELSTYLVANVPPKDDEYIKKEIQKLSKLVFAYNGDIHAPNFVIISYGKIKFKGRCTSFDYAFKLFDGLGIPHAADIKMKFNAEIAEDKKRKNNKTSSPDMTHYYKVGHGESLTVISEKIYGRQDLYLELARVNGLNSFRSLKAGTELVLPPLVKS
tara:strand:- start:483 stop:1199 length:717 start_codon:yes stop_codon:yes gene_type:complete